MFERKEPTGMRVVTLHDVDYTVRVLDETRCLPASRKGCGWGMDGDCQLFDVKLKDVPYGKQGALERCGACQSKARIA